MNIDHRILEPGWGGDLAPDSLPPMYYLPIMVSERAQRQIDSLLDRVAEAIGQLDWEEARGRGQAVLALEPENADAAYFLASAERALGSSSPPLTLPITTTAHIATLAQPTSFANDRYQVKPFLGESGKKKVYLAHDTLLDREVAFALIRTSGGFGPGPI